MQTYQAALAEFRAWTLTLVPEERRVLRRYRVPHWDGEHRSYTVEEDAEMIFSEAQQGLIFERYDCIATLQQYETQAHRQVYVQDAVVRLRTEIPILHKIKLIAISISPADQGLQVCKDIIAVLLRMTCFQNGGSYVYEQRKGPEEPAFGWHIHINLKSKYALSKVEQFVKQKLAKITCTYKFELANPKWESKYMKGDKGDDPLKKLHVAGDLVHRAAAGLQNFYEF